MTFIQINRYYKIWAQNIRAMFNVLFCFCLLFFSCQWKIMKIPNRTGFNFSQIHHFLIETAAEQSLRETWWQIILPKKNFKNLNQIIINIANARKTDLIDIRDEMDRRSGSMAENNLHLFQPQVRFLHFRRHLFRFDVVIVVVVSFVINPCPQCTCKGQTARCPI